LEDAINYVGSHGPDELVTALEPLARGESPSTLERSGYVVHSLQTTLHNGLFAESAEEVIKAAVNRGGDIDTISSVAGAVAGARFGAPELPGRWLAAIDEVEEHESLEDQLLDAVPREGLRDGDKH
jgi:ADP-ribosyl-[dinitrogen reductase] hydrolase